MLQKHEVTFSNDVIAIIAVVVAQNSQKNEDCIHLLHEVKTSDTHTHLSLIHI